MYITIVVYLLNGYQIVNAGLPALGRVQDGVFEVQVKVTGPKNSPNLDKDVLKMTNNKTVPIVPFANDDEFTVRVINKTDLPVYVLHGGSSQPGEIILILEPGKTCSLNSYRKGGCSFKVRTKDYDRKFCGGQEKFEGRNINRTFFLSPNLKDYNGKASDYEWKQDQEDMLCYEVDLASTRGGRGSSLSRDLKASAEDHALK